MPGIVKPDSLVTSLFDQPLPGIGNAMGQQWAPIRVGEHQIFIGQQVTQRGPLFFDPLVVVPQHNRVGGSQWDKAATLWGFWGSEDHGAVLKMVKGPVYRKLPENKVKVSPAYRQSLRTTHAGVKDGVEQRVIFASLDGLKETNQPPFIESLHFPPLKAWSLNGVGGVTS